MNQAASKRLRLRFFAEDERAVDEALALTTNSSKSNVIRAALAFYETVWASLREGFRVVFSRGGEPECPDVLPATPPAKPANGGRARTETSIEIRITPADHQRIQGLIACEAADTSSEAVRRAVRLYAEAAKRRKDGWEVVTLSPSGDVLHVPVPGMSIAPRDPAAPRRVPPQSRPQATGPAASPQSLEDLLPKSLSNIVAELADKEQCPPDLLLVDIIRSEALARLHNIKQDELKPAPEANGRLLQDLSAVFDSIDGEVENLMRLFGENVKSDGQQELSDLLFAAGLVDDGSAAAVGEETAANYAPENAVSDESRLIARAKDLNERLAALASIAAMTPRKNKKRTRKNEAAALQARDPGNETAI